jgi:hypothetical protein
MAKKRKTDQALWARLKEREKQLREMAMRGEAELARKRAADAERPQ